MRMKILFALALLLAPASARADSVNPGAANITLGVTAASGTAGLLYGDGAHVQSLPGTVTIGSGAAGTSLALANNVQLLLKTDGTVSNAAVLTFVNMSTTGGENNLLEVYNNIGGLYALSTYLNNSGIYYTTLDLVVSGHYSIGSGTGGHYGGGYSILAPNQYYQFMIAAWPDITGAAFQCRNNVGASGELCLAAQDHNGVFRVGVDPENTQLIFGATTITGFSQWFTGNAFLGSNGAANIRIGAPDSAAPVAQTVSFQNVVAGTSNTAGVNTMFQASAGTGSAAGGSFLFQTALPGVSGTAQNGFTTALTIDGAAGVTVSSIFNASAAIVEKVRTVSTATDAISASTDYFLCVTYTSTGNVTEALPAGVAGQSFLIKDCGGAAATHPITITPASGAIDGSSSYSLAVNYGSVAVTYVNSQWSVN